MDATLTPELSSAAPAAVPARSDSRPIARWTVAVIALVYGFAKLNGSQFTVLDSELDKPMGTVSGFWLTWYYFSYSPVYGNLIAVLQVAGGLLVTQRRYALLGALILLPITVNIVLVDVFYGIDLGATVVAVLLLALLYRIVAPHADRLVAAVVPARTENKPELRAAVAAAAIVIAAFALTYWTANHNNRSPTVVDGVWAVEGAPGGGGVERVFFEYNRAHMVVFKDASGGYREHHFEIDSAGRVRVWDQWLRKGSLLYEGTYTAPDRIRLVRVASSNEVLELQRLQ